MLAAERDGVHILIRPLFTPGKRPIEILELGWSECKSLSCG